MTYYDKEEIFNQSLELIKEHNLYFVEDIISLLPLSKPTFYDYYKVDSNEFNEIKKALDKNKTNAKVKIRKKLEDGRGAAELIAAYKLLCTDEERKKLSSTYIDHTTDGKEIKGFSIEWGDKKIDV